jgi:hypothetical protein
MSKRKIAIVWMLTIAVFIAFFVVAQRIMYMLFAIPAITLGLFLLNRTSIGNSVQATEIYNMTLNVDIVILCNVLAMLLVVELFNIDVEQLSASECLLALTPLLLACIVFLIKTGGIVYKRQTTQTERGDSDA